MRITRFEAVRLGPFQRVRLDFPLGVDPGRADVVLLVGPNGAGKTSVLRGIAAAFSHGLESELAQSEDSSVTLGLDHQGGASDVSVGARFPRARWESGEDFSGLSVQQTVFAYSAHRTWTSEATREALRSDTPAIRFEDGQSFADFDFWVSDLLARRDRATVSGNEREARVFSLDLESIELFLAELTGNKVWFDRDLATGEIVLASDLGPVPLGSLPEGLKSVLAWLGDLLRRLSKVPLHELVPLADREFVLLLDEIDVHLHPKWQRMILPILERTFQSAQIFVTTHSPFVLASATDAQIVWLEEGGTVRTDLPTESLRGTSYPAVLELMGITELQDAETTQQLHELDKIVTNVRSGSETVETFEAFVQTLPHTEDIALVVDMQRAQLKAARR